MTTLKHFNSLLLLLLLSVSERSSSLEVVGRAGENVTLPCKYDIKNNGATAACWGRGPIPSRGCNDQIINTDGHKVIESTRASSRFQLLGRLEDGDLSLTILNTTEKDAGRYGCRVEIPGLFNDEKHHIDLTIEKAPVSTTSPTTNNEMTTEPTNDTTTSTTPTHTHVVISQVTFTTPLPPTSLPNKDNDVKPEVNTTAVLVSVLFVLIALVTAGVIIIITRRWNRLKIPQQQVQFSSTSNTLHLHSRGSAVENIYQIDGDGNGEGGEYELCP